ncbi:SPOR domain-containing protein [Thermospira aquatica]|uniref:SPOR domain-containing protein n=1 Tax=Thermospira aquatica TaxID=2828656 RepID=A0AAX3BD67_9SPIR|nr:SPOR domain-containing protein [Thermospira aquatica]URA10228.1 SPOR domain-containing protein [Thermospira aquatica]
MADVDIMDLFDKEFVTGEETPPLRSSSIPDYKPSRSYQTQNTRQNGEVLTSKKSIDEIKREPSLSPTSNDIDEKLVWVGAIFVFFGVFAFLLGYWLGNMKEKEITQLRKEKQTTLTQQIEEKKTEIALKQNALPVQQAVEVVQPVPTPAPQASTPAPTVQEVPVVPSLTETTQPKTTSQPRTQTKPPSQSQTTVQTTTTQTTKPSPQTTTSSGGSYTIQISAHTDLTKAQAVETQLRKSGFSPYIVESVLNEVTYYRVRVGSYGSKAEAETALAKLKQLSLAKDAYILSLK